MVAATQQDIGIAIRHGTGSDYPFVLDSWLKSYSHSPRAAKLGHRYFSEMEHDARLLLSRSELLLATDTDSTDVLFGWMCLEKPTYLHYVYVKHAARRRGIATELLHSSGLDNRVEYTCKPHSKLEQKAKVLGWRFQPYDEARRCRACNARVAWLHLAAHKRDNCKSGLHQPEREPWERDW